MKSKYLERGTSGTRGRVQEAREEIKKIQLNCLVVLLIASQKQNPPAK